MQDISATPDGPRWPPMAPVLGTRREFIVRVLEGHLISLCIMQVHRRQTSLEIKTGLRFITIPDCVPGLWFDLPISAPVWEDENVLTPCVRLSTEVLE